MKTFILATTAAAFLSMPAIAADMPVKAPPQMVAAGAYNWSGLYSSSGLGVGWWEVTGTFVAPPPENHNTSSSGRIWYSGQFGYQHQFQNIVLGIEGGYARQFKNNFEESLTGPDCQNVTLTPDRRCMNSVDRLWTVGGKLGFASGNWLFYGVGGYATARIRGDAEVASTGVTVTSSRENHSGWYAGGGVDMFVTRFGWSDVIIGVDYRHIDLDTERHVPTIGTEVKDFSGQIDLVTVHLTFKLTPGGGPVMARY